MINGFVRGQQLTVRHPVIAADTINYLTALFTFHTRDWAGLEKWTHWQRGDVVYDIPLVNDQITEDAHLNLGAGEWTVWIHGNRYADGIVVQRITTDKAKIAVVPTGMLDGEPFPEIPASVTEQIFAQIEDLRQNGGGGSIPDGAGGDADTAESVVNRTRNARAMVTFADDDGVADVMSKLLPLSETYGIPFVSSMVTDRIGTDRYMTAEQLRLLQDAGWEIASHTMSHADLGTLTDEEQEEQLRGSKEALEGIGIEVSTICYPFSGVNENTWRIARKYYRCGRQTNYKEWMNGTPLETWDLRVTPLGSYFETRTESGLDTGTLAYYKWMADKAAAENAWLIFLTHCSETNAEQMGYLAQTIEYVQELGLPVVTIREGLELRGNTVDVGRYDRLHPSAEHYVVGCDATVRKSDNDKYVIHLPAGSVTNDTPPSVFPIPAISTCRIVGNSAGFPFQVTHYGGTLITNTMGENKDAYEGRAWQEFYLPDCVAAYRRCALDADTWSEWSYGSDVVLAQNSRTIDDPVTKFPKGMRTKVYLTQGTETTALPGDYGWLTTDRTNLNEQVQHQTFQSRSTGNLAGNVYYRVWNGSAWDPWTALGERTATTWGRNQAWFTKTVGTSVFDKTLGKPMWWNGTEWTAAADGQDGITPHIGENGNWYIGDTDTGVKAQGEPGKDGQDGQPGADGKDGEDYVLTGTDKSDIANIVLELLPAWEGGSY